MWLILAQLQLCLVSLVTPWPCQSARCGHLLATRPFTQHAVAGRRHFWHQLRCRTPKCSHWASLPIVKKEVFLSTWRYWLKREPNLIETASTPCTIELLWHPRILLNCLVQRNIIKAFEGNLWYWTYHWMPIAHQTNQSNPSTYENINPSNLPPLDSFYLGVHPA